MTLLADLGDFGLPWLGEASWKCQWKYNGFAISFTCDMLSSLSVELPQMSPCRNLCVTSSWQMHIGLDKPEYGVVDGTVGEVLSNGVICQGATSDALGREMEENQTVGRRRTG